LIVPWYDAVFPAGLSSCRIRARMFAVRNALCNKPSDSYQATSFWVMLPCAQSKFELGSFVTDFHPDVQNRPRCRSAVRSPGLMSLCDGV
jgi:hypothetical protein